MEELDSEAAFGRLLVEQGLTKLEHIQECLKLRREFASLGVAPLPKLIELLVKKGYLTIEKYQETIRADENLSTRKLAPDTASPPRGEPIGKYVKTEKLGEGGMGEVWKAWDTVLHRWVALKFLKTHSPQERERLRHEAKTAACLSHPNIAAVYEAHDNYLVMQLIKGQTLATFPRGDRKLLVTFVRDAALAIHYAHTQGIIHRDLKPQNIMIEGAPIPRMTPGKSHLESTAVYVMDFGLAEQMTVDPSISASGVILGTPAYMAPEQTRGHFHKVDARSDVYSLGVTLYELLTNRRPFEGHNAYEVLKKALDQEAQPLRRINSHIEPDLETIVMKCLEKDPQRRYATARELAEDLTCWLNGGPIQAHPPSFFYRLRKKLRKRRALVAMGGAGLVTIAVTLAILLPRLSRKDREIQLWGRISNILTDAEVYARSGNILEAQKRLDDGIRICREHLTHGEFSHAHYFLGRLLHARGNPTEAKHGLDRALELDPLLHEAHLERGLLLAEEYQSLVLTYYQSRRTSLSPAPQTREEMRVGMKAIRERAMLDLSKEKGQSSYFKKVDGLYGKALLALLRGDRSNAERELKEVLERESLYFKAHASLAMTAMDRDLYDQAVAHATDAIAAHKGFAWAYLIRAESYWLKTDRTPRDPKASEWRRQALEDAQKAFELGERSALAYRVRGNARHANKDLDGAIADWTEALRINPDYAYAYNNRGVARETKGDFEGALSDFEQALKIDPNSADTYRNRGDAYLHQGNFTGALADYTAALKINPRFASVYINRGQAYHRKGDLDAALADYNQGLTLDPDSPIGYNSRAVARRDKGDLDGAMDDFSEALRIDPHDHRAVANRGAAYAEKGLYEKAIQDLTRALEIAPRDWPNRRAVERNLEKAKRDQKP